METIAQEDNYLAQLLKLYRVQRHDFLNHFQVAMGYIQLGKGEKALDYLRRAAEHAQEYSVLSRIDIPELVVELLQLNAVCFEQGITFAPMVSQDLPQIAWTSTYSAAMDILREELPFAKGLEISVSSFEHLLLLTVKFIGIGRERSDNIIAKLLELDIHVQEVVDHGDDPALKFQFK